MTNRFVALAAAGLMLAACSQTPGKIAPPNPGSAADDTLGVPPRPPTPGASAPAGPMIVTPDTNGPASGEPTGPLTLQKALAQALLTNPDLGQFSYDVRSAEARTLQAGYRPNPEVSVLSEDFGGSRNYAGFQGSQTTLALSQLVELGGKRAARLRVARLDQSLAAWNYEAQRLDVLTAATRAFVDVVVAQRKVDLAETTRRIDRQFQSGVAERVRAGDVSSLDERRAQVTLANGGIALQQARHELASARVRLAAMWGSQAPQFTKASGDPGEDIMSPPPLPALLALAVRNPDVARWESEIAQREARVAAEQSRNVPDITFQAGPRYYGEGASAFVAGVGITLPAFGMNLGNQLDAQAQLGKSRLQKQAAEVRVATDIRQSHERLAAAYEAVKVLQQTAIPAAQAAYDGMSTGYREGKFVLTDVLDAQRALLDARMRLLDAQAAYHSALADMERLTGETLRTFAAGAKRPGATS